MSQRAHNYNSPVHMPNIGRFSGQIKAADAVCFNNVIPSWYYQHAHGGCVSTANRTLPAKRQFSGRLWKLVQVDKLVWLVVSDCVGRCGPFATGLCSTLYGRPFIVIQFVWYKSSTTNENHFRWERSSKQRSSLVSYSKFASQTSRQSG